MYFLTRSKRWIPDKRLTNETKALLSSLRGNDNQGASSSSSEIPTTTTTGNDNDAETQRRAANANVAIKNQLMALASQLE